LVNQERSAQHLQSLSWDTELHDAARGHSVDMATNNYFSHTSQDGRTFSDRIQAAGYQYNTAGENIAAGYSTPEAAMNGWMNSSGHRANILNSSYCDLGVGYAYDSGSTYDHYWTQDFGRKTGVLSCPSAGNQAPTASFTATPLSGSQPLTVHFDASASSDPDGSIASFSWSFGDGQTGTGQKPDHVYATAGTFTVTLTVTDNGAASDSLVRANLITVSNPSPGQYNLTIQVSGQGTVAMNPTGGSYAAGTAVTLTATADSGWQLSGWSGDLTGSANPAAVTMDANKSVTATFTETSDNNPPEGDGSGGGGGGGCFIDSAAHGWRVVP
jgi:PKD repeat protein